MKKNKALTSLENAHGDYCVDLFLRTDGTFGFEEYRRDSEDRGAWQCLHRYSDQIFKSKEDALRQAKIDVAWLSAHFS